MSLIPYDKNEIEALEEQQHLNPMRTKWSGAYNFFSTSDLYISEVITYGKEGRVLSRIMERKIHMAPPAEKDMRVHRSEDDAARYNFHLAILEHFYNEQLYEFYRRFDSGTGKLLTQHEILVEYIATIEFNMEGKSHNSIKDNYRQRVDIWKSHKNYEYWCSLYRTALMHGFQMEHQRISKLLE